MREIASCKANIGPTQNTALIMKCVPHQAADGGGAHAGVIILVNNPRAFRNSYRR